MKSKALLKSKTFWFNLLFCLTVLASYFGYADFEPNPRLAEAIGFIVGMVNIFLRLKTNKKIVGLR